MDVISTTELFAGRYVLGPLVGQGGMSDVHRATDQETGQEVAVKLVRSDDPELARRLAMEARVHQGMENPGLIKLLHSGLVDRQPFLVMEYVEGTTLAAALRQEPLSARLTARLGSMVGDALAYMHTRGIVHRDVKPSNIMLAADGRALLGDFGIARLLDSTAHTLEGTTLGTVAYMAPEQLEDHQVGPAADVWSLGIVLLECLTGRPVFSGTSSEILARRLAGPVPLPRDLPVPWRILLTGMLDHGPEQRLTAGQVASLLLAPPFAVPWSPPGRSEGESRAITAPHDLTALAPGLGAGMAGATGTATMPAATPGTAAMPATAAAAAPATLRGRGRARSGWVAAGILALAALVGGLAYGLASSPPAHAKTTHGKSRPPAPTSTSANTTTTTVPPPTAPTALAALVRDVASGVDGGTVGPGIGQSITNQAQQAVSDEAAGQPDQAANALQQVAGTIVSNEQGGSLSPAEGSILQADLATLAGTLGLSAASTPPSTTTTTTTTAPAGPAGGAPSPPGTGHGHHGGGGG